MDKIPICYFGLKENFKTLLIKINIKKLFKIIF